jgi:ankyrin repeat protein
MLLIRVIRSRCGHPCGTWSLYNHSQRQALFVRWLGSNGPQQGWGYRSNARRKTSDLSSFRCVLDHAKCDPNAQDNEGRTALSWCAMVADECAVTMVSDLLKRPDVDPNLKEESGQTALMRAVQSGNPQLVEALLQSNVIDPDLGSHRRSTPLRVAFKLYCEEGLRIFWEISRLLLLTLRSILIVARNSPRRPI